MAFGLTFDEIKKINHPKKNETKYGSYINAITEPEFYLRQFCFKKEFSANLVFSPSVLFIENGSLEFQYSDSKHTHSLGAGDILNVPNLQRVDVFSKEDTIAYLFYKCAETQPSQEKEATVSRTFDVREKYWGKIESIVGGDFAGKRIFMNAGTQSSLEYHLKKKEAYFLQSGKLKIGVRVGRAENKSVILSPGDVFVMHPGLMHMRIALEDSIIIEASTKDDDKDSNLVEDGKTYVHKEI